MEEINLDDYDLDYELQYVQLFTKLLEPYIKFEIIQDSRKIGVGANHLNIYLIKGCGKLQLINQKNFVYFLQLDFPRIIYLKMKETNDEINNEIKEHKNFIDYSAHNSRNSINIFDFPKKKKYYSEEYDKKRQSLRNKQVKLETISNLNKKYHGQVKDVLHFTELIEIYYL